MATKRTISEAQVLEKCRIAIENLQKQPDMAATMAQFGYDVNTINEGKALFEKARAAYDHHKQYENLLKEKYQHFQETKLQLQSLYRLHRKKAKLIFHNEHEIQSQLMITGRMPKKFVSWLETLRTFYKEVSENPDIAAKLLRLKVTPEEIQEGHTLIATLEERRSAYFQTTGECQLSTLTKEQSLRALEEWITTLLATAKIAFQENKGVLVMMGK